MKQELGADGVAVEVDAMREREFCVSYQEWEDGHAFQATRLHLADVVTELLKENWL